MKKYNKDEKISHLPVNIEYELGAGKMESTHIGFQKMTVIYIIMSGTYIEGVVCKHEQGITAYTDDDYGEDFLMNYSPTKEKKK